MGKIKNWENKTKKSSTLIRYVNTLPEFKTFHKNVHIVIGKVGQTSKWFVQLVDPRKGFQKKFPTKAKASAYAMKYMRAHPR